MLVETTHVTEFDFPCTVHVRIRSGLYSRQKSGSSYATSLR